MLKKSFKAGKCKTSLKLAIARIKLLKNKREVQLRQMKRDLAQLLESGQIQTARIRVEHVVREEKTMAAYDLIDIYCELIVARLPVIESQKTCPIDLKEAIASVVFASPRCADLPELLDVRKHFTSKYGKEFIASALELRPDCGVGRQIVEKLSVRAPDGETKIKILTAIAKEHNVNWDSKDFEEKELKPPEDLLNGPTTLGTTTNMVMESPSIQPQPQFSHGQKHDPSIRSSLNSQDYASLSTSSSMKSTTSHLQSISSESGNRGTLFEKSYYGEGSASPVSKKSWNMNFKDATEAAQVAAESAERASIAARAAAELSSGGKNVRQYSSEFHKSFDYSVREEDYGQRVNQAPKKMTYDSRTSSSRSVDQRTQNQDRYNKAMDNLGGDPQMTYDASNRRMNQSVSPGLTTASDDDDDRMAVPNIQKYDRYNERNLPQVESTNINRESRKTEKRHLHDEVSIKNQSSDSDSEVYYVDQRPQNIGSQFEGKDRQNSTKSTFSSHGGGVGESTTSNPDQNYGNNVRQQSFKNTGERNKQTDNKQPTFDSYPGAVFDNYSFDEDIDLDEGSQYKRHDSDPYAPSLRKSDSRSSQAIDSWARRQPRKNIFDVQSHSNVESHSSPEFPEPPIDMNSKSDNLIPATFDDSDGLGSESDVEISNKRTYGSTDIWDHGSTRSSFSRKTNVETYKKPSVSSSFANLELEDGSSMRNQARTMNFGGESTKTYSGHVSRTPSLVEKEAPGTNRKPLSSSDESESEGISEDQGNQRGFEYKSRNEYGRGTLPRVEGVHGHTNSPRNLESRLAQGIEKKQPLQTSPISAKDNFGDSTTPDTVHDAEYSSYSRSESDQGLNLGRLVGGLRNKGKTRQTYTKDFYTDASPRSTQQSTENTSTFSEPPNDSPKFKSSTPSQMRVELHNQKPQKAYKEFSSRSPKSYIDSDSDDGEPLSLQTLRSKGYTSERLNKPRDSLEESDTGSHSTYMDGSTEQVTPRGRITKKASTQISQGQGGNSNWSKSDSLVEQETHLPLSHPEASIRKGSPRSRVLKTDPSTGYRSSKLTPEPETIASSSNIAPSKTVPAEKTMTSKPSISLSSEGSNSLKKAGHVHPKLPDYDTFAAHFESLRSNRRSS